MSDKKLFDKTLRKIEYPFRWSGMNLESGKRKPEENFKYKCLYVFNFIWLNIDVSGAVWWFLEGVKRGESLISLTYVAPCITLSYLANMKSLSFIFYQEKVNELIMSIRNIENEHNNRENVARKDEIIKGGIDFLHRILYVFNLVNWACIVAFPLMPLTLIALKYFKTNEVELLLPFLIVYPFDAYNIKYWPFVYMRQIWSEMLVILIIGGIDYLFYTCSAFICIQFRLLQYDLERLVTPRSIFNQNLSEDTEFTRKLVDLVRWHQELIRLVNLLEVIYSKSTLYNFLSSSAIICLTGFNVTTIDDVAFMVSFLSFLAMSMLQIFFLCFFGDMLMRASTEVSDALYNCKWYLVKADVGKKLHFIQIRAQKPCKLTAYGFADVNLRAFTRILSTAWSYFALLKTVYTSPRG